MKKGYWVIRTYQSGANGEKTKYWVSGERPSRSKRVVSAEVNRLEKNETLAVRSAARVLNANFKQGDILLGLDYSEEGLKKILNNPSQTPSEPALPEESQEQGSRKTQVFGEEEKPLKKRGLNTWKAERVKTSFDDEYARYEVYLKAEHQMKLCLRRVKRECEKRGIELKYFAATSDMDSKTGEPVRVHHHLVINCEALEVFEEKWKLGGVHHSVLDNNPDRTAIAEYIIKQVRKIKDARSYVTSRNLIRPVPKDRIAVNDSELRVPAKAVILHRGEFKPGRPQYLRYMKMPSQSPSAPPLPKGEPIDTSGGEG